MTRTLKDILRDAAGVYLGVTDTSYSEDARIMDKIDRAPSAAYLAEAGESHETTAIARLWVLLAEAKERGRVEGFASAADTDGADRDFSNDRYYGAPGVDVAARASDLDAMCWDASLPVIVRSAANNARRLLLAGRVEEAADAVRDVAVSERWNAEVIAAFRRVFDIVSGGAK